MKKITRITALLLALVMLVGTLGFSLTSCFGGGDQNPPDVNPPVDGPGDDETAGGSYTVTVKTAGGMSMPGVALYVYPDADLDDDPVGAGTTDEKGTATIRVSKKSDSDVVVVSKGIPNGYDTKQSYKLSSTTTSIVVSSSVITDNTSLKNVTYKLGDVMRDFTYTLTDGTEFTLSEVLKEKDMVLINFWYVDCSACQTEFPYMQSVYASENAAGEKYADNVAILAVNPLGDSLDKIKKFKDDFGLTFDVAAISPELSDAFSVTGYPTSVVVDRYGVITLIEKGALPSEKPFRNVFDYYTGDNYEQKLFTTLDELTPQEKPNVEMPSSEEISAVLDGGSLGITYRPETGSSAEYSWPFIVTEKDGTACIKPSNAGYDSAFATLYADIRLEAGQVIAFDYFASSEQGADILYVIVNRDDIYQISGVSNSWKTCYAFVAPEAGDYELALCYMKDTSDAVGDDTVYLKNLRIVDSADEIDIPTYIPRNCATNQDVFGVYQTYSEVFYNETDGYYHVGSENGPLLLANLMGYSLFSGNNTTVYYLVADGTVKLSDEMYDSFIKYCNYASNSSLNGYCTVTAELRTILETVASATGIEQHANEWLQICSYYDAYGTGGAQLVDPIKGLSTFSAYPTVESEKGATDFPNSVYYDRVIMPRGLMFKFVPKTSGTYLVTSNSEYESNAWLFDADGNILLTYDNVDRMNFDTTNVYMMFYLEAGVEYYIDVAFYDVYQVGEIRFRVERWGDAGHHRFSSASPGYFTYIESEIEGVINKIISGGIDVELGNDGYWREKRGDSVEGSLLYADFTYPLDIFDGKSLTQVIEANGFDFTRTEYDQYVINIINSFNGSIDEADKYLRRIWGEDYDEYREIYKLEEVYAGIYHGKGQDLTAEIRAYYEKMIKAGEDPVLGTVAEGDARIGCVLVDARLAELLQMLMDKYTFDGVENSWRKLCYYHEYFGPAAE